MRTAKMMGGEIVSRHARFFTIYNYDLNIVQGGWETQR